MRNVKKVIVIASLLLAIVATAAAPAGATGGDYEHEGSAAGCLAKIDHRVKDVDKLLGKVAKADDVTPAHRSTLTTVLQDARAGLVALRAEIEGLSTAALTPQHEDGEPSGGGAMSPEVAAACERIFTDFRIYALRKPQVHLVLAADRVTGQRALFDLLASELEAAIAAAPSDPDIEQARRLLDDYRAKIDAAYLGAAGIADAVIGFGPADWNANPSLLRPYTDVMRQVKHDLKSAKKDAREILVLLGEGASEGKKTPGKA